MHKSNGPPADQVLLWAQRHAGRADAAHLVVAMCEHPKCADDAVQERLYLKLEGARVAVPTSAWPLKKLESIRPSMMRKRCNAVLDGTAVDTVSIQLRILRGSNRAAVVAIDEAKIALGIKAVLRSRRTIIIPGRSRAAARSRLAGRDAFSSNRCI